MLSVADKQTVCGSKWTYLGNPATGPGADQTYGAQSTFVLPYVSPSTNKTTIEEKLQEGNSKKKEEALQAT